MVRSRRFKSIPKLSIMYYVYGASGPSLLMILPESIVRHYDEELWALKLMDVL